VAILVAYPDVAQQYVAHTMKQSRAKEVGREAHVHGEDNPVFARGHKQDDRVLRGAGTKKKLRDRAHRAHRNPRIRHLLVKESLNAGQRGRSRFEELVEGITDLR